MSDFSVNPPHTHASEAQGIDRQSNNAIAKSESIKKEQALNIPGDSLNTSVFTQNINDLLEELRSETEIRPEVLQKFQNAGIFEPLSDEELCELSEKLIAEEIF